jgi:hypothetical protein
LRADGGPRAGRRRASRRYLIAAAAILSGIALVGCPRGGPRRPARQPLPSWQVAIETTGTIGVGGLAVLGDGRVAVAATASARAAIGAVELAGDTGGAAVVVLAPGGAPRWSRPIGGTPRALAAGDARVVVGLGGQGTIQVGDTPVVLRGEPGAALASLATADGAIEWALPVGATGWAMIRAVAVTDDGGAVAVGSFAGTLRAGARVVTAGGPSDGFAVRVDPAGQVAWLITAVAAGGDGLVVGGTFSGDADARGVALTAMEPRSASADGFVAALDPDGAVRWARSFGGAKDDAVAGVTITADGLIGVAATLRGDVLVDDRAVSTRGLADGAVITYDGKGTRRAVALIGGADYDTAAGIGALGVDLVFAGAYAGDLVLGASRLESRGGDGSLVAVLDGSATAVKVHDLAGDGRETVAALGAALPGWAAAVQHTAGLAGAAPAPADPYGGVVIVFRGE